MSIYTFFVLQPYAFLAHNIHIIDINNSEYNKVKAGILDDPQIRELTKDPICDEALSEAELSTWKSLKSVVTNFLGNCQSVEYEKEIEKLLKNFHQLGARISVKLHFLQSHLDCFPKNCGGLSKEQGECFNQDFCIMEEGYQG